MPINLKDIYEREKGHLVRIMENDPVEFVRRYHEPDDMENAGGDR